MHEVSIANEIITIVKNSLPDGDNLRVKTVKLELGEFSNIVPESLKFGFEVLSSGTELNEANLDIIILPLEIKCNICGNVAGTEPGFFYCSECGSNEVTIISGNELKVIEIELYDN